MKKRLILLLTTLLLLFNITGCDYEDDPERIINIHCESHYINTTESWSVNTHNGYKATNVSKKYDEKADVYTVTFTFKRPYEGE